MYDRKDISLNEYSKIDQKKNLITDGAFKNHVVKMDIRGRYYYVGKNKNGWLGRSSS